MRNAPNTRIESQRLKGPRDTNTGAFIVNFHGQNLQVIASDGAGWDHVSVSRPDRDPSWSEMCHVKHLFFKDDEVVMQLHPAKSSYVNNHPHCLHLWRPQNTEEVFQTITNWEAQGEDWSSEYPRESPGSIPLPPEIFVGIKELGTLT